MNAATGPGNTFADIAARHAVDVTQEFEKDGATYYRRRFLSFDQLEDFFIANLLGASVKSKVIGRTLIWWIPSVETLSDSDGVGQSDGAAVRRKPSS